MLFRLVLLLAIAGGFILFALSNWSPLLALTFLGMQTPAMPLALWILGAIAAGGVTSLLIRTLFDLSNYAAVRAARAQLRQEARRQTGFQSGPAATSRPEPSRPPSSSSASPTKEAPEEDDSDWQDWEGYEESAARPQPAKKPAAAEPADDWEKGVEDDWDWVEEEVPDTQSPRRSPPQPITQERRDYEAKQQQPKTASRSGSVYSYGYREPGKSGVGKPEKVVDADYRVIVPPYAASTPPATPSEEEADDWFEEDSDEFEDNRPRRSR